MNSDLCLRKGDRFKDEYIKLMGKELHHPTLIGCARPKAGGVGTLSLEILFNPTGNKSERLSVIVQFASGHSVLGHYHRIIGI